MLKNTRATESFHPSVAQWFEANYPQPTPVQAASWPHIAAGEHVLITAPTGSGKTLTAFAWSLSQFASGAFATGHTRVLYISPLKALNNDIQRNLLQPLAQLREQYDFPALRVQTRSGDTGQNERQKMLRQPPDILITTPESLGLLLTTRRGAMALSQVQTVILDEIHALVDNRRGTSLMVNLERLSDLAGEFQRIALSATVSPLSAVADYIAGRSARGKQRMVRIINPPGDKQIEFAVRFPAEARAAAENGKKIWEPLADSFRTIIDHNRSTLLFTNSRRLAEKITLQINSERPAPMAYAHHGSLSREVRGAVEQRLKAGELKAIVATNSLEMGIDIGALDEVILVQSPPSVAATLQRIGRAGHGVGEVSKGTLFPTHAQDFLEAAVLADAVGERCIEPQRLLHGPLDVLAQLIISICATDSWQVDQVYQLVTRACPYWNLQREHFDLVVDMLTGRFAGSRIRELKPRLQHDRIHDRIIASRGAVLALYNSGGTIPDRGYYQLRHADSGTVLGELDEEFVWEATTGQTFAFGTQHWQIQRITHNDVLVRPARADASVPPFWRSEAFNRSHHFSLLITDYLQQAEDLLHGGAGRQLHARLIEHHRFEPEAADELLGYLQRQRAHTGKPLPHRQHLLLEHVRSGPAGYSGPDSPQQLVLHTFWGGQLNQPYALALQAGWRNAFGTRPDIHADNNAIVIQCKSDPDPHAVLSLVTPENLLPLLRQSLEGSGFFGARFRECAGRALLLSKQRFNQRLPLWMSRLQAKKLMDQVKRYSDFPIMLETWRTCLNDEFDLEALIEKLHQLDQGVIGWSHTSTTTPSPFAANLTFSQVSRYMYADDEPLDDELSALSTDLIGAALHNPAVRPTIDPEVIARFEAKRQRREDGYAPGNETDWALWIKERILLPAEELPEDFALPRSTRWIEVQQRRWLTHDELIHVLYDSGLVPGQRPPDAPAVQDERDALQLAREILSFYGPLRSADIARQLPSLPDDLLRADEGLIHGALVTGNPTHYWCDAENFEALMRFQRAARRADIEPRHSHMLPAYWAALQSIGRRADQANLIDALELLRGYPTGVQTWLDDLLAARLQGFAAHMWDSAMTDHGFAWLGTGERAVTFVYPEEMEGFMPMSEAPQFATQFTDPNARYTFAQIAASNGTDTRALSDAWWQAVWSGQLCADSVAPLRQGLQRNFTTPDVSAARSQRRRLPRSMPGWAGNWQLLQPMQEDDALSRLETDKERVRLLLDRYGFVNRDLVKREALPLNSAPGASWRWRDAFRALRIMELAGEVSAGLFFETLSTPQFISARALNALKNHAAHNGCFWLAAQDPAAPCGLGLDWPELPQRRAGNYVVFNAGALALVVENRGRNLTYHVDPDDADLDSINAVLAHLGPERQQRLAIARINGEDARRSPFRAALERAFDVSSDHKSLYLEATY